MKIKTNDIETNYVVEGVGPWLTLSHALACNLSIAPFLESRRAA